MSEVWVTALAASPWLFPALFALVVADAFVVVLPSETAVVALAALSGATGHPVLWPLVPVAAVGAIVGDSLCYFIGGAVGHDRWRWQRRGRVAAALSRARETVLTRPAVLILTARYIPFARIAVNLSAGAIGLPYRRYLPLSALAGLGWALYNCAIGLFFGHVLAGSPVLAIVLSIAVAVSFGFLIDLAMRRISARRAASSGSEPAAQAR